ncbi:MAG: hypothetical protein ABEJ61_04770 [Haloferacaceae archaeon]
MRRRTAVALLGGGLASLSGCSALGGSGTATSTASQSSTGTPTPAPTTDLEVAGVDAPGTVEVNVPYEFAVRVRNPTDRRGTFESGLSLRIGGDGDWRALDGRIGGEVPPGETRTVSGSLPPIAFLNTYDLRLDATGRTWSFETVARQRSFGDAFETPRGLSVVVLGGSFTTSYTGGGNESAARTPPSGSKWAIVRVRVLNPTDQEVTFPPFGAFSLLAGGSRHAVRISNPDQTIRITGERTEFELPFVVPEDVTADDITVRWKPVYGDRSTAATWAASG